MENTLFICHRINSVSQLTDVKKHEGIELDLRDHHDQLHLVHDPFKIGENFESFLQRYDKDLIILNIKSERIEYQILDLLKKYQINNYFFLDSSFPMIYQLSQIGEKNIAIRFSEYESLESVELAAHMVSWVWIDCFQHFPLTPKVYHQIKELGLKICLVSPELQGHSVERIKEFRNIILDNNFQIEAICTKYYNIDLWKYG